MEEGRRKRRREKEEKGFLLRRPFYSARMIGSPVTDFLGESFFFLSFFPFFLFLYTIKYGKVSERKNPYECLPLLNTLYWAMIDWPKLENIVGSVTPQESTVPETTPEILIRSITMPNPKTQSS
jgi:hypothetical protein